MYALSVPGRGRASSRVRPFVLLAAFLVAAPLVTGVVPPESPSTVAAPSGLDEPGPTNPSPDQGPLDLKRPATVTLITGDKVTVYPDGSVETKPGPGRGDIVFDDQNYDGAVHVVPSDAARFLAGGKLDDRLFDVTYLIREGYGDASRGVLPLIVEGRSGPIADVVSGPGTYVKDELPKLTMSTVAQRKIKDRGRLWSRITDGKAAPTSLPDGIEKIWLDGKVHATLDVSVPQIGAPQVWDAGYTGEGVKVAVLDTGVDTTHPDLARQVVQQEVFAQNPPNLGVFTTEHVSFPIQHRAVSGALLVATQGESDPLVDVGRACVESGGDELLADPAGRTALIVRGLCPFTEKYDAAVEAGATGVVFFNNEPGPFSATVDGAEHQEQVWAATIADNGGIALHDLLADGESVALTFMDRYAGDLFGHGTHVASTIAGTGAASSGSRKGVAPDAQILNGKVLADNGGGQESWIIAGMEWAAHNGADVVNLSLSGSPTDGTDPMSQAINTLTETHDVLFAVAAGNIADAGVGTPGTASAALTVGAVDKGDELAWFSSRGPRLEDGAVKPNITAPGVAIVAARAAGTSMGGPVDELFTSADGTSMATPHVAGAAALLAQARPDLDASALKNVLASTAVDGGHSWFEQGTGRLDVARAVNQVVYADASLDFGSVQRQAGQVEHPITYTNPSDQVVTLQLEATLTDKAGREATGLDLSRTRLVVRPGRSASATLTIDPQVLGNAGFYGGVVTAAGSGAQLRTAVGVHLKRDVVPLADNWDDEWNASYKFDGPGLAISIRGAALSPDGKQIFIFGSKDFAVSDDDAALIVMSIDADTGQKIWQTNQPVPYASAIGRAGIALSPDGNKVFVSHNIYDTDRSQLDIYTAAFNNKPPQHPGDPELGEKLWHSTYEGVSPFADASPGGVLRIAASPDGATVVIVGTRRETENGERCPPPPESRSCVASMLTVAYDAVTGEQSWSARHKSPTTEYDFAGDVVFSATGDLAYVSGVYRLGPDMSTGITIAYEVTGDAKGQARWITHYGAHESRGITPHSVLSRDGKRLLVAETIHADGNVADWRMETNALDAATGQLLWSSQFTGADHGFLPGHTEPNRNHRGGIAVSPDNDLVYVTGEHCEGGTCGGAHAIVTVAYDQMTGEERWHQIHEDNAYPSRLGGAVPRGVAAVASPDGSQVYVAGACCWETEGVDAGDSMAVAYDAATGELLASARHRFDDDGRHGAVYAMVDPHHGTLYTVTYVEPDGGRGQDYWGVSAYTPPIPLLAAARRSRGSWSVDLTWSGAVAEKMDIYRDGTVLATVGNSGAYTDEVGKVSPGQRFSYRICVAGTTHCSEDATVTIGRLTAPAE